MPKYSVYAIPRCMTEKEETAASLAAILDKDKSEIREKLSRDKLFVWIARKVSDDKIRQIKKHDELISFLFYQKFGKTPQME